MYIYAYTHKYKIKFVYTQIHKIYTFYICVKMYVNIYRHTYTQIIKVNICIKYYFVAIDRYNNRRRRKKIQFFHRRGKKTKQQLLQGIGQDLNNQTFISSSMTNALTLNPCGAEA